MHVVQSQPPSEDAPPAAPSPPPVNKRRAGIYLLPNLFTTSALFAGFYGIVAAINGRFEAAAVAILVAMIFDGMDGRIARLTNTQTDFGAEYDSLSDMVSFGLAPALVMYQWALHGLGKIGWVAAFMYTAGAALRLARFNTQIGNADKRFFQGLPSPAAAALIGSLVWFGDSYALRDSGLMWTVAFFATVAAALLMVSNLRYYSGKNLDLHGRVPFVAVLALVMVFVLIAIEPPTMVLLIFACYAASGVVETLVQRRRRRAARREGKSGGTPAA